VEAEGEEAVLLGRVPGAARISGTRREVWWLRCSPSWGGATMILPAV
jgi:hypothetical protein